jgi:hypothetical protein
MDTNTAKMPPGEKFTSFEAGPVGGPVAGGWREGTLTRAMELESLCAWALDNHPRDNCEVLPKAVACHLDAARQAATRANLKLRRRLRMFRSGPLRERAMSNLDAAEAQILNFAPADYILGQISSLLRHIQCHLVPSDPRRQEFERIARKLGVKDPDHPLLSDRTDLSLDQKRTLVDEERGKIVTAMRGACSASMREQLRLRSFRNVLVVTTLFMTVLAIGIALTGYLHPTLIPLCFAPEEAGQATVVCPTAQSAPFKTTVSVETSAAPASGAETSAKPAEDIDDAVRSNATKWDLLVVELVGLIAAAVAATAAIRGIRGSSERYGLPVALAALKLPTGAVTAFLGLLLMRGQFVPGLSALDTSAQILAWALMFGYAQQLFTRLVDRQGQTVLETVRGASAPATPSPT